MERCLLCPCNAGTCRLWTSSKPDSLGRLRNKGGTLFNLFQLQIMAATVYYMFQKVWIFFFFFLCVSPLSDPVVVAQDELVVNPEPESAESSSLSIGIEGCNNTSSETKTIGNGISKAFAQAAEHLQNELLALLETMDPKDHEAMSHEAETTFTALDHLCFNRQHLEKRVKELVSCAKLLAKTEQSVPEKELGSTHDNAVATVGKGRKRLKILKDNISSAKDWVFQAETDMSSFEVELRNMEHQLEQISKDKEVLEIKYLIASKELEDSKKHCERREEAKAAFNRARALLRG
ncbi:hypothetical protein ACJIZ3_004183 [Penstemon smallii]|uniref:Uncharacterized protein n=1 Tax=Penstemon smallii TaxID=265156 RepID=A0ABD3S1J2_9LAMI